MLLYMQNIGDASLVCVKIERTPVICFSVPVHLEYIRNVIYIHVHIGLCYEHEISWNFISNFIYMRNCY